MPGSYRGEPTKSRGPLRIAEGGKDREGWERRRANTPHSHHHASRILWPSGMLLRVRECVLDGVYSEVASELCGCRQELNWTQTTVRVRRL